jgi:hypothetical protein
MFMIVVAVVVKMESGAGGPAKVGFPLLPFPKD